MADRLRRTYLALLLPAVVAVLMAYGAKQTGLIPANKGVSLTFIAPVVFVFSVAFAVALPILIRSLFAHRMRSLKRVPEAELIKFEEKLLRVSLLAPYFVIPAYLLDFPKFYFTATSLMALYAAYFFYPSKRRIAFERRIFRVEQSHSGGVGEEIQ